MKKFFYSLFLTFFLITFLHATPSIEKIIGQLLMIGFEGETPEDIETILKAVKEDKLGGVLLLKKNIKSPEQLSTLTKALQAEAKIPLLIAVDQEGGFVARLNKENGFEDFPSAKAVSSSMNLIEVKKLYRQMAHILKAYGINYNLAPVVDVENENSPIIGSKERAFSPFPANISLYAQTFVDAFKEVGVLTSLKHFPGHGNAREDSHTHLSDISLSWEFEELRPYFDMIQTRRAQSIMVAHVYLKRFDLEYPASLSSSIVNGVLRKDMGYSGMVISDDLLMEGAAKGFNLKERIVLSLNAGVDMLIISSHYFKGKSTIDEAHKIIYKALEDGEISETSLRQAYDRILTFKKELP